jgi:hypothetical protein
LRRAEVGIPEMVLQQPAGFGDAIDHAPKIKIRRR